MEQEKTYLLAPKSKRLGAWILDTMAVFLLWYLMTANDLVQVNELMKTLNPEQAGALDTFATAILGMLVKFLFKLVFCQTLYYCLVPALFGRGKTVGKILFRLCTLDANSLEEISPSKLVLREFVTRGLLETLLVLPGLVSVGLVLFSKESRSLRDRFANTIVSLDGSLVNAYD